MTFPTPGRCIARIAVDLLGGDNAPAVVVDGALRACGADPDLHLLLVGPSEVADQMIAALPAADRDRVKVRCVRAAARTLDVPSQARRHETTVRAAVAAVAEGHADALVSAGATGATVTAAVLGFGRSAGVRRPALAATVPAVAGPVVLLDVGATVEASPATLTRNAVCGAAYASVVYEVAAPRVGLLSIGSEPGKGDRARRTTDAALTVLTDRLPANARYVGLVEGHDVCVGERADVVVTDGFTGNVLLKGIEGAYALATAEREERACEHRSREASGSAEREDSGRASCDAQAGESLPPPGVRAPRAAALLGVRGTAVVCHGAATGDDLASGIALAARLHRRAAIPAMSALLTHLAEVTP